MHRGIFPLDERRDVEDRVGFIVDIIVWRIEFESCSMWSIDREDESTDYVMIIIMTLKFHKVRQDDAREDQLEGICHGRQCCPFTHFLF